MILRRSLAALVLLGTSAACSPAPLPPPVTQAEAVAESDAIVQAQEYAPQAVAAAEKVLAEAHWLHDQGRHEEAAAAGEEAIAAYSRAFALARAARAEERIEAATKGRDEAAAKLAELDRLQSTVAQDADAYEMRARVHLDTEAVADEAHVSPERARARRLAAKQLASEARLLCVAGLLLDKEAAETKKAQETVAQLETELSQGSVNVDLYPRAAKARAACLERLTSTRRPAVQKAPHSAASDRLLTDLTETGKLFAFRDDRGIVINLGQPLDAEGKLTPATAQGLDILGGTAKSHPEFPVLVVTHTAKRGQESRATAMGQAAQAALLASGAKAVQVETVDDTQPIVSTRVRGADEKNERLEVIFVVPGR